jgi:hypothetical protein
LDRTSSADPDRRQFLDALQRESQALEDHQDVRGRHRLHHAADERQPLLRPSHRSPRARAVHDPHGEVDAARHVGSDDTPYALYDTVGFNGQLYLVITSHTSGSVRSRHSRRTATAICSTCSSSINRRTRSRRTVPSGSTSPARPGRRSPPSGATTSCGSTSRSRISPSRTSCSSSTPVVDADHAAPGGSRRVRDLLRMSARRATCSTRSIRTARSSARSTSTARRRRTITVDFPADVAFVEADVLDATRADSAPGRGAGWHLDYSRRDLAVKGQRCQPHRTARHHRRGRQC